MDGGKFSTLLVFLVTALLSASTFATYYRYTWIGRAGNGLWSDAKNWAMVKEGASKERNYYTFPSGSSDAVTADMAVSAYDMTLASGFAGTITLEADVSVENTFTQADGVFRVNGHRLEAGGMSHTGGTFDGTDSDVTVHSGVDFKHTGGIFRGGRFSYDYDGKYLRQFYCNDGVFESFRIYGSTEARRVNYGSVLCLHGTNTVSGDFSHEMGILGYGNVGGNVCRFRVGGDVYIKDSANGATPYLDFVDGKAHVIRFSASDVDPSLPRCPSVFVDNGSTVSLASADGTARFGYLLAPNGSVNRNLFYGIRVENGTFDASGVETFEFAGADTTNTKLTWDESVGGHLVFPDSVVFSGSSIDFPHGGLTFKNFSHRASGTVRIPNYTTNTVTGTMEMRGGGFTMQASGNAKQTAANRKSSAFRFLGDLIVDNSCGRGGGNNDGEGVLIAAGETDQHIYCTNATMRAGLVMQKPAGTKLVCEGVGPFIICGCANEGPYMPAILFDSGTFVFPKDGFGGANFYVGVLSQAEGAEVDANGAPFIYKDDKRVGYASLRFRSPLASLIVTNGCCRFSHPLNTSLTVKGDVTLQKGGYIFNLNSNGVNIPTVYLDVEGDVRIENGGGSSSPNSQRIRFTGSDDQHYLCEEGGIDLAATVTVAKPSGKLVLDSDFVAPSVAASRYYDTAVGLTVDGSTLDLAGHAATFAYGPMILSNGGRIADSVGTGRLTCKNATFGAGGTLAIGPSEQVRSEPLLTVTEQLELSTEVGGNVASACVAPAETAAVPYPLISYGTLKTPFDAENWSFVPAGRMKKMAVAHDSSARLISFSWRLAPIGFLMLIR